MRQVDCKSREYLEQFDIRRVQVELTEQGILIRPPEKEHHTQDHVASSGDQHQENPRR